MSFPIELGPSPEHARFDEAVRLDRDDPLPPFAARLAIAIANDQTTVT